MDRCDGLRGNELHVVFDAGVVLQRVHQSGGCGAQRIGSAAGNDGAVGQFERHGRLAGDVLPLQRGADDGAVKRGKSRLFQQQFLFIQAYYARGGKTGISEGFYSL